MGSYKAGGREYQPTGEPVAVDTYDFIDPGGKMAPYGVFVVAGSVGWVDVGTDADTGTLLWSRSAGGGTGWGGRPIRARRGC